MQPFLKHRQHRFFQQAIARAADFSAPFNGSPYPCLVWNHGVTWSASEADALAGALIDSNCRYIACAGTGCDSFHDTADQAFIRRFSHLPEGEQDERYVMTSLHPGEEVDDTTFFFAFNTSFDNHEFHDHLLIHIGGDAAAHSAIEASLRKEVVDEAALYRGREADGRP